VGGVEEADAGPVLDQLALTGPLMVAAAALSHVKIAECDPAMMAGGSPVGEPKVAITFDAFLVEPLSLVMPVTVLRRLVAASSPFLAPPPGDCAPADKTGRPGGASDG
jgi:hypothetical protein